MRLSRRVWFFLGVAGVCLAMLPPTPSEFRLVNVVMAAVALFWAVAIAIEDMTHRPR
jgi:arginine exporter protein ArgO